MTQQAKNKDDVRKVHIPEITGSLKTLFILRTIISIGLIGAGIAVLMIGSQMLLTSLSSGKESVLFEIANQVKITASGFGAVVMATSVIPFIFAYKARPTLHLYPTTGGSHYNLSSEAQPGDAENAEADTYSRNNNTAGVSGSDGGDGVDRHSTDKSLRREHVNKNADVISNVNFVGA
jgi:hypothetical protein